MKTPEWAHATNIYEVNIRQYTAEGTFNAFIPEMPRLKDMGIQTLWFMPITPIAKKNAKGSMGSPYACSDYCAVNPEFGSLDDFKNLVKEAHQLGLKVIIDWVANHTGWDHIWTVQHPDFYKKDYNGEFKIASGMEDIIELNYDNPEMRGAMISALKFWIEQTDIDGYRCDLASWVPYFFWEEARPQVETLKQLFWLGEFDELENPEYGKTFDASYSWKWMHQTEHFYKQQQPLEVLETLLRRYVAIGDGSMRAWFTSNHDENSWNGTEYEKYGAMAAALAVFSATWNGIPLVYSGQEIPLRDKRLAFFEKDAIPWTGRYELHNFYQTLLNLHSSHPALRAGDPSVSTRILDSTATGKIFAYLRTSGDSQVLVVLNFSGEHQSGFHFQGTGPDAFFRNLFSGDSRQINADAVFDLAPWDYLVFTR